MGRRRERPLSVAKTEYVAVGLSPWLRQTVKTLFSDDLITLAAKTVDDATGSNFDRDNIRAEPTTKKVLAECQKVIDARVKESDPA